MGLSLAWEDWVDGGFSMPEETDNGMMKITPAVLYRLFRDEVIPELAELKLAIVKLSQQYETHCREISSTKSDVAVFGRDLVELRMAMRAHEASNGVRQEYNRQQRAEDKETHKELGAKIWEIAKIVLPYAALAALLADRIGALIK
jgi:hypothetical protein